jgi:ribose transport system ATP-binding protein
MGEKLMQAEGICKSFSGVRALDSVHFDLYAGEVHALLGENGAGKSTLMKIFSGAYTKDAGDIHIRGQKADIASPRMAQEMGIGIIHQELNLCPHLTVAENMFLGREFSSGILTDRRKQRRAAREILAELHVDLDVDTLIRDLPVSKQQMVEICKTLSANADIIIMDEPTSALSEREIEELFRLIHDLKQHGKGIIYISHRLEELSRITDRVTILRDGCHIDTRNFTDTTLEQIIQKMVGRRLNEKFPKLPVQRGDTVFEVGGLNAGKAVRNVSFKVYGGEIVGIAGLVGAGRTETVRAIFGADKSSSDTLKLRGKPVVVRSPSDAIRQGVFLVPEDRKLDGLCTKLTVSDNLTMPNLDLVSRFHIVSRRKQEMRSQEMIRRLAIKTSSVHQYVKNLSGGNQQKVVVGKWLMRDAEMVIFDEPTRGIDVAAKIQIYSIMNDLKKAGIGVVFVSSELPEIMGMSDRVMCNGRITADLVTARTSQEEILRYATEFTTDEE